MPDFYDAAKRHFEDAEHLFLANKYANADQLFGLSAECALKAIMLTGGMPMKDSGSMPQNSNHRRHIDKLWDEFITFADGRLIHKYADSLGNTNLFSSWDVSHRYENRSVISQEVATQHKAAADQVLQVFNTADIDGIFE